MVGEGKKLVVWDIIILLLLALAIFQPLFFFNEDIALINIAGDLNLGGAIDRIWTESLLGDTGNGGLYRPIPLSSLWIDHQIWGLNSWGYHLRNIALNMICTLLVYLIARQLIEKKIFAFIPAIFFLFHPAHPATIYWISARADLFCTMFYLAGVFFIIRYLRTGSIWKCLLGSIAFLFALFSKEMAVSAPLIIIPIAFLAQPEHSHIKKRILPAFLSATIPAAIYFAIRVAVLGNPFGGGESYHFPSPGYIPINLAKSAGFLILPFGHEVAEGLLFANRTLFLGIAILAGFAGIALLALFTKRDRRNLWFAIAVAISILPVLGLTMRWHMYLPSAFLALLIGNILPKGFTRIRNIVIVAALFLFMSSGFVRLAATWDSNSEFNRNLAKKTAAILSTNPDADGFVLLLLPSKINRVSTFTNGFPTTVKTIYNEKRPIREFLPSVHSSEYHSCEYSLTGDLLTVRFDSDSDYIGARIQSYLRGEKGIAQSGDVVTQDGLKLSVLETNKYGRISTARIFLGQSVLGNNWSVYLYCKGDWKRLQSIPSKTDY